MPIKQNNIVDTNLNSKGKRDKIEAFIVKLLTKSYEFVSIKLRLKDIENHNNTLPKYFNLTNISIISIMKLYLDNSIIGNNYRINRNLNIVKDIYNDANHSFNTFFSRDYINNYIYYKHTRSNYQKGFYYPNIKRVKDLFNHENKYKEKDEETLRLDFESIKMFYIKFL